MNGKVLRILDQKGFGFIEGSDGVEYFFHRQDYVGNFNDLVLAMRGQNTVDVTFDIAPSQKGPRAANVFLDT